MKYFVYMLEYHPLTTRSLRISQKTFPTRDESCWYGPHSTPPLLIRDDRLPTSVLKKILVIKSVSRLSSCWSRSVAGESQCSNTSIFTLMFKVLYILLSAPLLQELPGNLERYSIMLSKCGEKNENKDDDIPKSRRITSTSAAISPPWATLFRCIVSCPGRAPLFPVRQSSSIALLMIRISRFMPLVVGPPLRGPCSFSLRATVSASSKSASFFEQTGVFLERISFTSE